MCSERGELARVTWGEIAMRTAPGAAATAGFGIKAKGLTAYSPLA